VRLYLEQVKDLTVTEEEHNASFELVLENKVLVIVADFGDVALNQVVKRSLPLRCKLVSLAVVVNFLLSYFSIKNLLVHAGPQRVGDTALGVLDKKWLVVLLKKALANQNPFVVERLFLVHSDLAHLHVELDEFASDALHCGRL